MAEQHSSLISIQVMCACCRYHLTPISQYQCLIMCQPWNNINVTSITAIASWYLYTVGYCVVQHQCYNLSASYVHCWLTTYSNQIKLQMHQKTVDCLKINSVSTIDSVDRSQQYSFDYQCRQIDINAMILVFVALPWCNYVSILALNREGC